MRAAQGVQIEKEIEREGERAGKTEELCQDAYMGKVNAIS